MSSCRWHQQDHLQESADLPVYWYQHVLWIYCCARGQCHQDSPRCSTGQSLSAGLWSVYRIWSSSEHRQSVCDVWFLLPYKAIHKIKTTSHKLVACVIFLSLSSSGRIWLYMCSVWFGSCWTGSCHGMQGCWCFQDHRRWHQPRQIWDRQDFWSNWVCEP